MNWSSERPDHQNAPSAANYTRGDYHGPRRVFRGASDAVKTPANLPSYAVKVKFSDSPMASKQVKLDARREGVSERTPNPTEARFKVRSTREAYGWTWTMQETSGNQDDRSSHPGNLTGTGDINGQNPACLRQDCQGCQRCQGSELANTEERGGNLDGWLGHRLDCECNDCLYAPPDDGGHDVSFVKNRDAAPRRVTPEIRHAGREREG